MVFAHYIAAAFTVAALAGTPAAIDLDITDERTFPFPITHASEPL